VIADPPLVVDTATYAFALPIVTEDTDGVPGTVYGVAVADATAHAPDPAALYARSHTVYSVDGVRLDIVIGDVVPDASLYDTPKSVEYWYFVMADPPVLLGAANASEMDELPAVATTDVGAPGTVYGVATSVADPTLVP
jgi:hypothetical protein